MDPTFDDPIPTPQTAASQDGAVTFDDLIPGLQAGAPQDGVVNFEDLIPNPGAPPVVGEAAAGFGQTLGGAIASGPLQDSRPAERPAQTPVEPVAQIRPGDIVLSPIQTRDLSADPPKIIPDARDGGAAAGASPGGSGQDAAGAANAPRAGGSPAISATGSHRSAPDYSNFYQFYVNWAKNHNGAPAYIPESQWNPNPPDPTRMTPETKVGPYKMITFHHTGSEDTPTSVADFDRGREDLIHYLGRQIVNGFNAPSYDNGDVSYHFPIGKDGKIYEGRSLGYEGAHVYGQNPGNIGVAFIGDYSSQPLSDAQMYSAKALIHALNDAYGVYNEARGGQYVFTHRDLAPAMGPHARPTELLGAQRQMNAVKAWSIGTLPPAH